MSTAVALLSCGEAAIAPTAAGPGLDEDAAAATAVPDEGGPAILVAHSYGGMVASQAGEHPAVQHLVYISSFLPAVGESLAALSSDATNPVPVTPHADGSVSVNNDDTPAFDARFLHDIEDSKLVRGAHDRLCAQSSVVFGDETTAAAWQRVPFIYVVCAEDRSTDPELQRVHTARAINTRELPAAHSPMLSRPDLVAACIKEVASRA